MGVGRITCIPVQWFFTVGLGNSFSAILWKQLNSEYPVHLAKDSSQPVAEWVLHLPLGAD